MDRVGPRSMPAGATVPPTIPGLPSGYEGSGEPRQRARHRSTVRKAQRGAPVAKGVALGNAAPVDAEGTLGQVIANHVRTRRLDIGLNVGQLAERTGISKGMLSKIENAQTSPSLSTLERLAGALDMPVTSLFRGLAEERDAVFVKAGSGPEIVRKGTRADLHTYELLGSLRGPYNRVRSPCWCRSTRRAKCSRSSSMPASRSCTC